jgi:hypothetical protein
VDAVVVVKTVVEGLAHQGKDIQEVQAMDWQAVAVEAQEPQVMARVGIPQGPEVAALVLLSLGHQLF